MNILVIGAGGVGASMASIAEDRPFFSTFTLADSSIESAQRAIDELSRSSHFTVANVSTLAATIPSQVPPIEEEPENQFEEDMSSAHLDDETQETIEALQHDLEDMGELTLEEEMPVEEEPMPEVEEEPIMEEEDEVVEELPETPKAEVTPLSEEPAPEDPKKSSGSFFDQFD